MEKEKLICISCPVGCHLEVDTSNQDEFIVEGNKCKRGIDYAKAELTNPTRVITSTVYVNNGFLPRLPVRSNNPIPKKLIFEVMDEINLVKVDSPIKVGDVIIKNVLNTGCDIIASRSMKK